MLAAGSSQAWHLLFIVAVLVCLAAAVGIRWLWLRYGPGPEIPALPGDDSLYVVTGADGAPERSQWPPAGAFGNVPRRGRFVTLPQLLDAIGPEVWLAKRQGDSVCLIRRAEHFNDAAALSWAADCIEHLARSLGGIALAGATAEPTADAQATIAKCVSLARNHARGEPVDPAAVEDVRRSVEAAKRQRSSAARSVVSWANRFSTSSEAGRIRFDDRSQALRFAENSSWLALSAAYALCDTDFLRGARRACALARKAASYHQLAEVDADQASGAESSSYFRVTANPFGRGPRRRSAQVRRARPG